jgi:hypothetical protein
MTDFIYEWTIQDIDLCDDLIKYHKEQNEYKILGVSGDGKINKDIKDSIDVPFWPGSSNPFIKKYFQELQIGIDDYFAKYPHVDTMHLWNREPTNIQYYSPGGGFKKWHYERDTVSFPQVSRGLVFMTYLNDVTDKGETEWFYQDKKIKPRKGLSVIWPVDFTHTHRGIPSPTQEKYIVTGWLDMIK